MKILGWEIGRRGRATGTTTLANPAEWLISLFGGKSKAGANVSVDSAMRHAAVISCIRILAEDIAKLPLITYRRDNGKKQRATDHPLYLLLHEDYFNWNAYYGYDRYWSASESYMQVLDGFSNASRQDYEHIYICTTSHTSASDWPTYTPGSNYPQGTIVYDGVGGYWQASININPAPDPMNYGDWTFVDNYTAKWLRMQGQLSNWTETPWVNRSTGGEMAALTWADALTEIAALDYNGYTDWRLANWAEVTNLIDCEPAYQYQRFGNGTLMAAYNFQGFSAAVWTSTNDYLYTNDPTNCALTVGANSGCYISWYGYKTATLPVIIVRSL